MDRDNLKNEIQAEQDRPVFLPGGLSFLMSLLSVFIGLSPVRADTVTTDQTHQVVQSRNILFSRIGVEKGLSQGTINSIVQDQQGYLWFGTQEGLNRFDGKELVVFDHNFKDTHSLSNDWVWSLLVDRNGVLWVGTDGGGLNRFDRNQEEFKHFRHDPNNPASLSNDRIRVVYEDRSGIFWIGTDGGGLNRFDPSTNQFFSYRHASENPASLPHDTVLSIYEDQAGKLWVGTNGGGLARLDRETGEFVNFQHNPKKLTTISSDQVRAIFEDRDGNLWIGTYEGGLNIYDAANNSFTHYKADPSNPMSLSNNRIRDIFQDREGTLWIATDGGLNEWLPQNQGFNHYRHDPSEISTLSDDRVSTLYEDRGGVLWVGTYNGINKWNYISDVFTYYQQAGTAIKINNNIVTSVTEEGNEAIWVGMYGGGVNRIDLKTSSVSSYDTTAKDKTQALGDDRVMSLFVDKNQIVWIGTRSGGLNRLDPILGKIIHYKNDPQNSNSISADSVSTIAEGANGTLWIGTYGGGLNRFYPNSGKFSVHRHNPDDQNSLSSDRVLSIYRDRLGVLWVGTEDGGLNRFDESSQSFIRYMHDRANPDSLSNNTVLDIIEDVHGSLWIATSGGGLNRWAPEDRLLNNAVFTKYRKGNGLRSDTVLGITIDGSGLLWLSSNRGLIQFDPDSRKARYFDQTNGLKGNEFNAAARLKSKAGALYFGGTSGLVSFHPEQVRLNRHKPDIALEASNRIGPLGRSYSTVPEELEIKLTYKDDLITFNFAALDFSSPDKNQFRYKLEGFDHDWSIPVNYNRATYTSLPSGEYIFRVSGSNNDGVWSEKATTINLAVLPPPWRSKSAYVTYVLVILSIITLYLRNHARKLRYETAQRVELERQVRNRTQELAERNDQLNVLNAQLKEASWTDSLTGLKNRRYLDEFIQTEVADVKRRIDDMKNKEDALVPLDISPALCFMMIDLDGFKVINDTYGHHAGDQALLQVRDVLQRCCRKSDTIIRWGGDEFLIVGRRTTNRAAEKLAERIRAGLAEHQYQLGGGNVGRLSGSIGFALYPYIEDNETITWDQVAAIADRAAYTAKENGRNAWVSIQGANDITSEECTRIKNSLEQLVNAGRVTLRTSIEGKLVLSEQEKREKSGR